MTRDQAVAIAQAKFKEFMAKGELGPRGNARAYGFTWRALEGRWDIYSCEVEEWHVSLSDNGGALVSAIDCSNIDEK